MSEEETKLQVEETGKEIVEPESIPAVNNGEEVEDTPAETDESPESGDAPSAEGEAQPEEGESGEPKAPKEEEESPTPPRKKVPKRAPPPPPPKSYDVPADTFSTKPVSNRVWEVDEEEQYEEVQEEEFNLEGTPLSKDFTSGPTIGRGFYAIVRKVTEKSSGKDFAVKILDKSMAPQLKDGNTELDILKKLSNPNVLVGKNSYDTETHSFIVVELAESELAKAISKNNSYSEGDVRNYVKQLAEGLSHIHEKGIIHGDLSPENILSFGSDVLKIGGFSGSIISSGDSESQQVVGNSEFQAPELIMNQGFNKQADLWSLGCCIYFLATGRSPFQDTNAMRMKMKIRQGKFDFENTDSLSSSLKDLISSLIKTNPDERLSASDVTAHAFLKESTSAKLPQAVKEMASIYK